MWQYFISVIMSLIAITKVRGLESIRPCSLSCGYTLIKIEDNVRYMSIEYLPMVISFRQHEFLGELSSSGKNCPSSIRELSSSNKHHNSQFNWLCRIWAFKKLIWQTKKMCLQLHLQWCRYPILWQYLWKYSVTIMSLIAVTKVRPLASIQLSSFPHGYSFSYQNQR